ncbi:unnamed protein product, partial [Didymodactylos carnosus]
MNSRSNSKISQLPIAASNSFSFTATRGDPFSQTSTNSSFPIKSPATNATFLVKPLQTTKTSDVQQPPTLSESTTTMIYTSLPHSIRVLLSIPNVNIYTFGESYLIGYCDSEYCLYVYHWDKLFLSRTIATKITQDQCQRLRLSSLSVEPVQRLLLNKTETILTMLAENVAYIVHLPPYLTNENDKNKIIKSTEKSSPSSLINLFCPIICLSQPSLMNLIDFIWLPSPFDQYFLVAYSNSQCLLYKLSKRGKECDLCQTYSITLTSKEKKISLNSLPEIIKLDYGQQKYSQEKQQMYLPIFAIKTDGNIYCLYLYEQDIITNSHPPSFTGPLRIYPSSFDNYGCRTATMTCIKSSSGSTCLVYIRDKFILNQSLVLHNQLTLNESIQENHQQSKEHETILYIIDSIILPEISALSSQMFIIYDPLSDKRYYVADESNIYSIDIEWLDNVNQIQSTPNFSDQYQKRMSRSKVEYLMTTRLTSEQNKKASTKMQKDKRDEKIKFMGLAQTMNNGQWLCIITENDYGNDKHITLLRPNSAYLSPSSTSSDIDRPLCLVVEPKRSVIKNDDFFQHIRSLLQTRDETIPRLRSTNSQNAQSVISDDDFEKNLQKFIDIFTQNYLSKQLQVQKKLENKQRYLFDLTQTQLIACRELETTFKRVKHQSDYLLEEYSREQQRRQNIEKNLNDILSVIENITPVLSDQELLMKQQLKNYHVQLKHLQTKTKMVNDFIYGEQKQDE